MEIVCLEDEPAADRLLGLDEGEGSEMDRLSPTLAAREPSR
jgi:hypothetical protein